MAGSNRLDLTATQINCRGPHTLQEEGVLTLHALPMHSAVLLDHLVCRPAAAARRVLAKEGRRQDGQLAALLLELPF